MNRILPKPSSSLLTIPFREVRHFQPEDALHFEAIRVRAELHQWTIPAHQHAELHQFQLLTQGSALATLDGESIQMTAPFALMVAPGVVHSFVYDRHSVGHQLTVPTPLLHTALGVATGLESRLRDSIRVTAQDSGSDLSECDALFAVLANEFGQNRAGRGEALASYATLVALWYLRHADVTKVGVHRQALKDTLIQRYRSLLEQHFREQRPVHFYAAALGITADHLSRTCRAITGDGALDLMHDRVVLEARRLLAYTPGTIVDIALALGFYDPGHFSRFFAKIAGQSPSEYRAAMASGLVAVPADDIGQVAT